MTDSGDKEFLLNIGRREVYIVLFIVLLLCGYYLFQSFGVDKVGKYDRRMSYIDAYVSKAQVTVGPFVINDNTTIWQLKSYYYKGRGQPYAKNYINGMIDEVCNIK